MPDVWVHSTTKGLRVKIGDYVRLTDNGKVYQITAVMRFDNQPVRYKVAATADHPDAAVRVQDALAWHEADRLVEVRRR